MENLLLMYLKTGILYIILLRFVNKKMHSDKRKANISNYVQSFTNEHLRDGEALHVETSTRFSLFYNVNYMQNSRHVF